MEFREGKIRVLVIKGEGTAANVLITIEDELENDQVFRIWGNDSLQIIRELLRKASAAIHQPRYP